MDYEFYNNIFYSISGENLIWVVDRTWNGRKITSQIDKYEVSFWNFQLIAFYK